MSDSITESVTRSLIELSWAAKNTKIYQILISLSKDILGQKKQNVAGIKWTSEMSIHVDEKTSFEGKMISKS